MERKLFGTDGIRGRANEPPMTGEMAMALGRSVGALVRRKHAAGRHPKVVLGKDTRVSCYLFEQAISSGLISMGCDVLLVGPLPTPGIAFVTQSMRADAGIVISASHNPYHDNGIKVFDHHGFKLPDEDELLVDRWTSGAEPLPLPLATGGGIGRCTWLNDVAGRYIVYLKSTFPAELTLDGVRIVVDCAHGAAYRIAPAVFSELGAEVVPLGVGPDGLNINEGCGSLHPEVMQAAVVEHGAQLGLSLDGDADRVILADERGRRVDGDQILAICAQRMKKNGRLARDTVVATVMSNLSLELYLRSLGVELLRAPVGDRYVVAEMRAGRYNLGGEQSGHLIFLDHGTTGDGVLAALQVLAVMLGEQLPLSELAGLLRPVPQLLVNIEVKARPPLETLPEVSAAIARAEALLSGEGRVLVRYSGTELLARVMVEGPDQQRVRSCTEDISRAIREAIGA
ncbi:MAG: phosphoglucosamine mutase [Deltaproteobacteria bacterium]|nr:phosphoglucosamine mutase [Deltaproteobacteria bacterium]